MHDLDHILGDADHFRDHLRECRLVALPVAVRSGHHHQTPGRIHPHRGGFVQTGTRTQLAHKIRRRDAASLDIAVYAEAAQLAFGLGCGAAGGETGHV